MRNLHRLAVLLLGAVCAFGAVAAPVPGAPPGSDDEDSLLPAEARRIEAVKADISLLNLVNGLNLSETQVRGLLEIRAATRAVLSGLVAENADLLDEAEDTLSRYRAALEGNGRMPKGLERNAGTVDHELTEAGEQAKGELERLVGRLRAVFTPEQLQVIIEFNPCVIPPKSLKDPVRVGQARGSDDKLEEVLAQVRSAGAEQFERELPDKLLAELRKQARKVGGVADRDLRAEQDRLLALFREARELSDAEFPLRLKELTERMKGGGGVVARLVAHEQGERDGHARQLDHRLAEWFLTPRAERILRRRLEVITAAVPAAPTDLDRIQPAEPPRCGAPKSR